MTLAELRSSLKKCSERCNRALTNEKIKFKLFASLGYGRCTLEMQDLEIFRKAGSIFVKCQERTEALILLSLIEKIEFHEDSHKKEIGSINSTKAALTRRLNDLIPTIPVSHDTMIEIEFDNPDDPIIPSLKDRLKFQTGYPKNTPYSYFRLQLGSAWQNLSSEQ